MEGGGWGLGDQGRERGKGSRIGPCSAVSKGLSPCGQGEAVAVALAAVSRGVWEEMPLPLPEAG